MGVTAFARINNLLDRHYQDPIGFQHPGLGVFAGVRVAFDTGSAGKMNGGNMTGARRSPQRIVDPDGATIEVFRAADR